MVLRVRGKRRGGRYGHFVVAEQEAAHSEFNK
jgi:hypothetical protein